MGLFNWRKKKTEDVDEKLNPAQSLIGRREGGEIYSHGSPTNYRSQYESIEIVNRAINMIVDDSADMPASVGRQQKGVSPVVKGVRKTTVERVLCYEPNPFQDISSFKRNLIVDLLVDGNMFIYWDGAHLYHLPADKVSIHTDERTFISHYSYAGLVDYFPDEIIHIKENSFRSIYRGTSRMKAAAETMDLLIRLRKFQKNFFKNGAVPGLVLKSPDALSEKIKERMLESWRLRYRPEGGGRSPMILDGGLEIDSVSNVNFKELDFQSACSDCEETILKALGVPPILFRGGNNANIAPNHKLYYLETVLPIIRKINAGLSRFFGYEVHEDATNTPALQPTLSDQSSYLTSLVNGGVITPNEARERLGREALDGLDEIRIPVNIAGSAANPAEGGRPAEGEDE